MNWMKKMSFAKERRTKLCHFVQLVAVALLLVTPSAPLAAQTPTDAPVMEISLAWEGTNRQTWWTEAHIVLRNENTDWQGDVVVIDKQNEVTYRLPVELPAHSYKQYHIPLFVKSGNTLAIALQDDAGLHQEYRVVLNGLFDNSRVVVMADTREPFLAGPSAAQDARIWLNALDELPETSMAWDTVDVLLLNGISTADLTPTQQEALLAWVAAGGHLIVGGGPSLPQTLDGLPEQLRVAASGDTRILEKLYLESGALDNVAAVVLRPVGVVTPLVQAGDDAFAVRGAVGKGHVDIVGWDMAQPGGEAWLVDLWARDPVPAITTPVTDATPSSGAPTIQTLLRIPLPTLPKIWLWLLIFPLYIFLMGPGTLLLVRRLRRPVLAWILLPTWIIGAILLLAFGLSSAFSRTFPLVREVAIVTVPGESLPAKVVQGTAIYAPRIRDLTWNTTGSPRPLSGSYLLNSWYTEGDPFPIEARYLDDSITLQAHNPLGIVTWGTEGLYDPPSLRSELGIEKRDGRLFVTGEMQSEVTLHDVTLLLGDAAYAITLTETLSQDASIAISGKADDYRLYGPLPITVPPEASLSRGTACYVTGRADGVPFPAYGIGGTHIGESCLIYTIPCPTQPAGKIEAQLEHIQSKTENGWIDETLNIVYGYEPNTVLSFGTPAYLRIRQIEKLTLALLPASEAGILSPLTEVEKVSLWNWDADNWIDYPPAEEPLVLTGAAARQVFDAQQGVRLRLKPKRESMTVKVVITVEGTE